MSLHDKYKDFTMVPREIYEQNLVLCNKYRNVPGCVVECGVWKGGMIAGIAETLGHDRRYFLFDSFEGLPVPTEKDSAAAFAWQADKTSPTYYNNCGADITFATRAMAMSGANKKQIVKGWFSHTLPSFDFKENIAILRLDADWYASTMVCLESLYKQVVVGGIVIFDDYYIWDGCTKAVHEFLVNHDLKDRIRGTWPSLAYIEREQGL